MSAASKRQALVGSGIARGRAPAPAPLDHGRDDDAAGQPRASDRPAARVVRHLVSVPASSAGADTLGHLPAQDAAPAREDVRAALQISPAVIAGVVFALCGVLAAATVQHTLASFAQEGGVNPAIFLAVPGLFAALFAIVVYQGARRKVTRMAQSFSRALLVALLTWASFSALATTVWCKPEHYGQCYSSFLIVSGLIGGGPMLLAAGVAGAIVGWLTLRQRG